MIITFTFELIVLFSLSFFLSTVLIYNNAAKAQTKAYNKWRQPIPQVDINPQEAPGKCIEPKTENILI